MEKNFKQPDVEAPESLKASQELPQELEVQEDLPIEERVDMALEEQEADLEREEAPHDRKTLSGLKKWAAAITLMGSSLLAVGCNAEKPAVENADGQKVESTDSGFKDDYKARAKIEVKHAKERMKYMKESARQMKEGTHPSQRPETKKFVKEMQESQIVQPIQQENGDSESSKVQRPNKEVKPGTSGKVMNSEDL